jgi:ankyrin repeat protein
MKKNSILNLFFLLVCFSIPSFAGQASTGKLESLAQDRQGNETTLHVAIANNNIDAVKAILELDKDGLNKLEGLDGTADKSRSEILNQLDNTGETVVAKAFDDTAILKELLSHDIIDANAKNQRGFTPLQIATFDANEKVVKIILESFKDRSKAKEAANTPTPKGNTPLHMAIEKNAINVVKILLDNGADAQAKGIQGKTPFEIALSSDKKETAKALLEKMIQYKDRMDINFVNEKGETALFAAVDDLNDKDLVQRLIAADAKINYVSNNNQTPLDIAKNSDIKQWLIDNGAKTFAQLEQEKKDAEKISQEKKEQEEATQRQQALEKQKAEAVEAVIQEKALLELARALKTLG